MRANPGTVMVVDEGKLELEKAKLKAEVEAERARLREEHTRTESELRARYEQLQVGLRRQEEQLSVRASELELKEQQITNEETRVMQERHEIHTLITERVYTADERVKIVEDYQGRLEQLRERLRENEKALRGNNKEFIPLRRIRDTLERDMKLLRKREAIVARQQVLVYGVNNITTLDPERVKKLEQDVQQLTGLQQSVANCEDIMHKNRDRFPTLENLDKVLRGQNRQIRSDIEEYEKAISFFETQSASE